MWTGNMHFGEREEYPGWLLRNQLIDQVSWLQHLGEANKAGRDLSMHSLGGHAKDPDIYHSMDG